MFYHKHTGTCSLSDQACYHDYLHARYELFPPSIYRLIYSKEERAEFFIAYHTKTLVDHYDNFDRACHLLPASARIAMRSKSLGKGNNWSCSNNNNNDSADENAGDEVSSMKKGLPCDDEDDMFRLQHITKRCVITICDHLMNC